MSEQAELMCPSCREWRMNGCAIDRPHWPRGGPGWCDSDDGRGFNYEPGCHPSEFEPGRYEELTQCQ